MDISQGHTQEMGQKLLDKYKFSCEVCGSYPELKYIKQFNQGEVTIDISTISTVTLEVLCHAISQSLTPFMINITKTCTRVKASAISDEKKTLLKILKAVGIAVRISINLCILKFENLFFSPRMLHGLCQGLSKTSHLSVLTFKNCPMKSTSVKEICLALKNVSSVTTLAFDKCWLCAENVKLITNLITHQGLSRGSILWKHSLRAQMPHLERMRGLRHLLLNNNPHIGDEGAQDLLKALSDDIWIAGVELQNCGITPQSMEAIEDLLKINQVIEFLSLENNPFLESGFVNDVNERLHQRNPDYVPMKEEAKSSSMETQKAKVKLLSKVKTVKRGIPWRIEGRLVERKECLPIGTLSLIFKEIHNSNAKRRHKIADEDVSEELSLHHIRKLICYYKTKLKNETKQRLKTERKVQRLQRKLTSCQATIDRNYIIDEQSFFYIEKCFSKFASLLNKLRQDGYHWANDTTIPNKERSISIPQSRSHEDSSNRQSSSSSSSSSKSLVKDDRTLFDHLEVVKDKLIEISERSLDSRSEREKSSFSSGGGFVSCSTRLPKGKGITKERLNSGYAKEEERGDTKSEIGSIISTKEKLSLRNSPSDNSKNEPMSKLRAEIGTQLRDQIKQHYFGSPNCRDDNLSLRNSNIGIYSEDKNNALHSGSNQIYSEEVRSDDSIKPDQMSSSIKTRSREQPTLEEDDAILQQESEIAKPFSRRHDPLRGSLQHSLYSLRSYPAQDSEISIACEAASDSGDRENTPIMHINLISGRDITQYEPGTSKTHSNDDKSKMSSSACSTSSKSSEPSSCALNMKNIHFFPVLSDVESPPRVTDDEKLTRKMLGPNSARTKTPSFGCHKHDDSGSTSRSVEEASILGGMSPNGPANLLKSPDFRTHKGSDRNIWTDEEKRPQQDRKEESLTDDFEASDVEGISVSSFTISGSNSSKKLHF